MTAAGIEGLMLIYDDFSGNSIDHERWSYLTLPQRGSLPWTCSAPNARTQVGEGTLDIEVECFTRKHNKVQAFDNLKHVLVSTHVFSTRAGWTTFALDMAATSIGLTPTDYRDGFASFMVLDQQSGWSFSICCNGKHTFGLYDALRKTYHARGSAHVFEAPAPRDNLVANSRHHELTLDGRARSVRWSVDGQLACRVVDAEIPADVSICLGMVTLTSLDPPPAERYAPEAGLSASFGPVSVHPSIVGSPTSGSLMGT